MTSMGDLYAEAKDGAVQLQDGAARRRICLTLPSSETDVAERADRRLVGAASRSTTKTQIYLTGQALR
jgi:hypothetical protein